MGKIIKNHFIEGTIVSAVGIGVIAIIVFDLVPSWELAGRSLVAGGVMYALGKSVMRWL